jgi:EpsI family protein
MASKFNIHNSKFIIVIVVLLLGAALNDYLYKPDITLPRRSLSELPKALGDWTMISEQQIDDKAMKILQVDDYLFRTYRNSKGEVMGLYIGYFKSQREGKGIHSPRQCLPGAGWAPLDICIYRMSPSDYESVPFRVNKFVMGKGLERQLYLFWYQGRGRMYASEYWNKIYLILDALTRKRTDGALVRVNSSVVGNPDESLIKQSEFIRLFYPLLKEYIPE